MPASWSVANNAMEAPTGPDGARPCDCTGGSIVTTEHRTNNDHKPARCMARLYRTAGVGTSLREQCVSRRDNGSIFPVLDSVFLESQPTGFL